MERKVLVFEPDTFRSLRLDIDVRVAAQSLGLVLRTIIADQHLEALRLAETEDYNYLLTTLGFELGDVDGVLPGVSVAKAAYDHSVGKERILIYVNSSLPDNMPTLAGIAKIPFDKLNLSMLKKWLAGQIPHYN